MRTLTGGLGDDDWLLVCPGVQSLQRTGVVKGHGAPKTHSLVSQHENASQRQERLGVVGAAYGSLGLSSPFLCITASRAGCC